MLVLIPQAAVLDAWGLAAPYLDRAVKAGALQSLEDWRSDCVTGAKQLWLLWSEQASCDGAGLTSLTGTPQGKTCIIDAYGGRRGASDFNALLPTLEAWAKAQGCQRVRVYGRIGWMEKLNGYALKGVILDRGL